MKRPPTDLEILSVIYDEYLDAFHKHENRQHKNFIPIDISMVSKRLRVDDEIVFGRLYFDLENRYGYKDDAIGDMPVEVSLFALRLGDEKHCINFSYMTSVLADLQERRKRFWIATAVSWLSLGVALSSLIVSVIVAIV